MSWTRWKAAEKEVAVALGGLRRLRACDYSESCEDVIHHKYSIEVKYGKQIPKHCAVKVPTLFVTPDYWYYLCPFSMWKQGDTGFWWGCVGKRVENRKFLERAFDQAVGYDPKKIPLVCLKPVGYKGFVVVERVTVWEEMLLNGRFNRY